MLGDVCGTCRNCRNKDCIWTDSCDMIHEVSNCNDVKVKKYMADYRESRMFRKSLRVGGHYEAGIAGSV